MSNARFEALVREYQDLVMSLLRRNYGGVLDDHREDIAQEVWTKLWIAFEKNESNIVNFKSYLYRTVQTTVWDAARGLEKHQHDALDEATGEGDQPKGDAVLARVTLDDLMARLKPEEARMMRAHLQGFTYAEIATLVGTREGRVRNLISRIKKKMSSWSEP